ncbi:hypothetical protein PHYBLDRAFT_141211 [Phycomyces blakesleeanus NRRL 1555(-)]|uniref:Uncharacterized protein n=1 Tax=Phycomyces blakesleeanus (strain ATCC 8743b / DSM 1359 / FGSC 10004 / NBRC 33097 / NRRL 1555) TaxID=763407 RepID=A0A162XYI8_PHYB8|nr:hypothetical protein PHYBLDRAFT_141211 [Phycomyces blakesleeanus NRRL 1555(-)]OAD77325.1 hypothetical protein PHYBLDRAFT_141211 [Phycomyces blakesleeanus NRRL 1555(-)]|eukprot:XP_018295365.1 hypothetical protein PHYBLDRAFT_141211 [Phycomyces blakesleeanus NRRL 1555(-)]
MQFPRQFPLFAQSSGSPRASTILPAPINCLMLVPSTLLSSHDNFAPSGLLPSLTGLGMSGFAGCTISFRAEHFCVHRDARTFSSRLPVEICCVDRNLVGILRHRPSALCPLKRFPILRLPPTLNPAIPASSVFGLTILAIWDHHWSFHFNSVPFLPSAVLYTACKSISRLCSELELDSP